MSMIAQTIAPGSANVEMCSQANRRGAPIAALQQGAMVKGTAPIRVISFLLLAACGALCQSQPSADLPQGSQLEGPNSPQLPRQKMRAWSSLPDAPSPLQPPTPGAVGVKAGVRRGTEPGAVTAAPQQSFTAPRPLVFPPKESGDYLGKYLYPQLLKPGPSYIPSSSGSFWGRASYAASSMFITHDGSGKGKLNTSYFLGVLAAAAVSTASRPYWARSNSPSPTFNSFGVSIGSDAGINVFNEFRPSIRHVVKGFTPKFASRIGERITHDPPPRNFVSIPAR
jgi:hypothetical protein